MKSTMCFFVRDLATRQIVHHEIKETDTEDLSAVEHARSQSKRISELMSQYPSSEFDVFLQGFDSLSSLYSSWPELDPTART
jgi:hypothetical protein